MLAGCGSRAPATHMVSFNPAQANGRVSHALLLQKKNRSLASLCSEVGVIRL